MELLVAFKLSSSSEAHTFLSFSYLSAGLALVFLSFVFISRKAKPLLQEQVDKIKNIAQNFIMEVLYGDINSPEALKSQNDLLKISFNRQILIEELIQINQSLSGEETEKLRNYYIRSGLVQASIKKIKSNQKDRILEGLKELVSFKAKEYLKDLEARFFETKDKEIKNYILAAIFKIRPKKGFNLLLNNDYFLTDWFQLVILKDLEETGFIEFPEAALWDAKKESLRLFGKRIEFLKSKINGTAGTEIFTAVVSINSEEIFEISNLEKYLNDVIEEANIETSQEIHSVLDILSLKTLKNSLNDTKVIKPDKKSNYKIINLFKPK